MSGNGPLLMLAGIQEYLPAFKPATVLWFYFEGNDLQDLAIEAESRILSRYLQGGFNQGLGHLQQDIDSHLTAWVQRESARELHREEVRRKRAHAASARSDAFLKLVKLTALRQRLGSIDAKKPAKEQVPAELEQRNLDLFVEVLSVADAMVSAWGGRLYFVYLPDWGRYGAPTYARLDRDPVLTAVTNPGIPVIDMHLAFKDHKDPLSLFPFRRFGHYNEEGQFYQEIARIRNKSGKLCRFSCIVSQRAFSYSNKLDLDRSVPISGRTRHSYTCRLHRSSIQYRSLLGSGCILHVLYPNRTVG